MPTETRTRRTYRIVTVSEMLPGDIIKMTRKAVASVTNNEDGTTDLTFRSGAVGQFFSDKRFGIYR